MCVSVSCILFAVGPMRTLTRSGVILGLAFFCALLLCCRHQVSIGSWHCPNGHRVEFDGGADALFSMRQKDSDGRVLLFTRAVCDELVAFVFYSRSTYAAATAHFSATKRSFALCRQYINVVGRLFVATLQACPEAFRCPICQDNPEYIIIDGQALGFRRRAGMNIVRPSLLLPVLDIPVKLLCILPTATLRKAVRKILRCAEKLTKSELLALQNWRDARGGGVRRRRRSCAADDITVPAATAFFTFFPLNDTSATAGSDVERNDGRDAVLSDSSDSTSPGDGAVDDTAAAHEPEVSASSQWSARTGPCSPSFSSMSKGRFMAWAALRTFLLALLGDPVVGMFHGIESKPLLELSSALQADDPNAWHERSSEANCVGFVANFLARMPGHLVANSAFRKAIGRLLEFVIRLEDTVDARFDNEAQLAADRDQGVNQEYCDNWGGEPTASEFAAFAAAHPAFKGKDLDSPYTCFEYYGALPRVRPGVFAHKVKRKRRQRGGGGARSRRPRRHQAAEEDDNDRCKKAFPKHPDLTCGVFNVVCPHVVTLGFRVMFDPESVSDALSVILERFPKLPKVVFYDVGCKLDRNAMRRVRRIFRAHKVKVVLDRVHAKGHTCSPVFFPNEALGMTNGVATQAAEVQHSVSIKFRSHLAYMSPESFMAHRIVQLSLMNLVASYKLEHPDAKEENEDANMAEYYHSHVVKSCSRDAACTCAAALRSASIERGQ